MKNRKRFLFLGSIIGLALLLSAWISADWLLEDGEQFLLRGKTIRLALLDLGQAIEDQDLDEIQTFYADGFQGLPLGLNCRESDVTITGIARQAWCSRTEEGDRQAALEEWREYLTGFEEIEKVAFSIHRLRDWRDDDRVSAITRFDLIGRRSADPRFGVDRAYFEMDFSLADPEQIRITSAGLVEGSWVFADEPLFRDVSVEAGIDFTNRFYPDFLDQPLKFAMIRYGPAGISTSDFDNDGFYDLFIPDGVESRLYRNRGNGTFEDVTPASGLEGLDGVSVGVFGDFDNDGHRDLFVSRTFRPNQLFKNNGDGTFTDVTRTAGIGEDCCTTVASWADYDNDGFLDLYVGRYLDPREKIPTTFYARNGEPNQLYKNNGDGTFTNVTETAGVGETGLCLGTVFGDYNNDGWPDLYVVNDFGRNTLYRNQGDGTFTDVTEETGTLAYGAGMSATFGDYDNDTLLDIYVTNIRSEEAWFAERPTIVRYMYNSFSQGVWWTDMPLYFEIFQQSGFRFVEVFQQMASGNTLLRNRGDGTFEDTTWEMHANPMGWFWSASLFDFNHDGWQDIYAANGWIYNTPDTELELEFLNGVVSRQEEYKRGVFFDPDNFTETSWHGWERNRFLLSDRGERFIEAGRAAGADLITNSRGVAVADFENRGRLDVAVSASTDRHRLLRNDFEENNWIAIDLIGTKSNRDAIGARIVLDVDGQKQMREVVAGDGYGSQNSRRAYFGLGTSDRIDEMRVIWPASGIEQSFRDLEVNRFIELREGAAGFTERPAAATTRTSEEGAG